MCLTPQTIFKKGYFFTVGCGKCFECLQRRSTEWAYRVALESELYEHNCMITLTYNEDNLPKGGRLVKRDLQLFMKRLRKHFEPRKIRFFGCGEYGSKNGRPHYHIILFNLDFEDKFFFCKDNKGTDLYRSPILERLWHNGKHLHINGVPQYYDKEKKQKVYESMGFSSVGEVNFVSAKYCAIYMQKPPKDGRPKAFTIMSRRPGIGFDAIRKQWLSTDKIYYRGKYIKIPRYFLDVFSRDFPNEVEVIKNKRMEKILTFNVKEQAEIEFKERLQRIKKLQKIFKDDFKSYFDLYIDFGELTAIKENSEKILKNLKKSLDK